MYFIYVSSVKYGSLIYMNLSEISFYMLTPLLYLHSFLQICMQNSLIYSTQMILLHLQLQFPSF